MQVASHRKLAFLEDEAICTLKQFSIYEELSLIVMSNYINLLFYWFLNWVIFYIFKNFLVSLIEYNFPFCFPVVSEMNLTMLWGVSALCVLEPERNKKRNYKGDRVMSAPYWKFRLCSCLTMPHDFSVQIQPSTTQTLFVMTHKVITYSAQSAAKPQQNRNSTIRAELHTTVRAAAGKSDGHQFFQVSLSPFWAMKMFSQK